MGLAKAIQSASLKARLAPSEKSSRSPHDERLFNWGVISLWEKEQAASVETE